MISISTYKVQAVQKFFKDEIEKQREIAEKKLKGIEKSFFNANENDYLDKIIKLFEDENDSIILASPDKIKTLIGSIGKTPPNSRFGKNKKPLKEHIIDKLNYKALRKKFYPKYFQKIGIKTCVYCNSQLSVVINKNNTEYSARFDVDHHHSKDDYPFLSISLFNLYPACAPCNRRKSKCAVEFELYSKESNKLNVSGYEFILDSKAKANYLLQRDPSILKFIFKEPPLSKPETKTFQEVFRIEELYATQKDIAEELIIKSQIYNASYKKALRNSFSKLALNSNLFERLFIGNYPNAKDIHKRPMAKFTQDIARQLKLIQ